MNNKDICSLRVNEISEDNSILFLWATFPKIQEALDVIKAWGFIYKTIEFNWVKTNPKNGKPFFGVGWYTKSNAEVCLIGVKGKAPKISNSISSIIITPRGKHSEKPNEVRERIVKFCGDIPRIELFARKKTEGWEALGSDIDNKDIRESIDLIIQKNNYEQRNIRRRIRQNSKKNKTKLG